MSIPYFERLSGLDSSFLLMENRTMPMHVSATLLFDGTNLLRPDGGLDFPRIRDYIASRLHLVPRYRQRLAFTPIEGHPVWIDDDQFDLDYHLRHSALPKPGNESALQELSSRIMSQPLDRSRPLWEMWLVEGLQDRQIALISKTHHCMIDGISGVDLLQAILRPSTEPVDGDDPPTWTPRPAPSALTLLEDTVWRWSRLPLDLTRSALRTASSLIAPRAARLDKSAPGFFGAGQLLNRGKALWRLLGLGLLPTARTPLNRPISPHRRFIWLQTDLDVARRIKSALGGSVNDVVLAIVTGALIRYFEARGYRRLWTRDFRVLAPVSMHTDEEKGTLGNDVSGWLVRLPLGEANPRERLRMIHQQTHRFKETNHALGAESLTKASDWSGSTLLSLAIQLTARVRPFNLVVTNVPGPSLQLYLADAALLATFPQVPLFENLGLGIALFSYAGKLNWGFTADWDLVPDLEKFKCALLDAVRELEAEAKKK